MCPTVREVSLATRAATSGRRYTRRVSRFRARTVALLFAISVVAVSSAFGASKLETASPTLVSVDLGATRQTIAGFGCSTRVWSDPHLSKSPQTVVPAQAQAQI